MIRFSALHQTAQPNYVGTSGDKVVKYDAVEYNEGLAYNPLTGVFTAPYSGTYLFSASIRLVGIASSNPHYAYYLDVDAGLGQHYYYRFVEGNPYNQQHGGSLNISGSIAILMEEGEKVSVKITANGGTSNNISLASDTANYFTGIALTPPPPPEVEE